MRVFRPNQNDRVCGQCGGPRLTGDFLRIRGGGKHRDAICGDCYLDNQHAKPSKEDREMLQAYGLLDK